MELAELITRFTPAASTTPIQRAAYPFTRLRADGVWLPDRHVAMDSVGDLNAGPVNGRIEPSLEAALQEDPALAREVARRLATATLAVIRQVVDKEANLMGVPEGIHDLVAAGLRKDPSSRPTARQIRDALTGT